MARFDKGRDEGMGGEHGEGEYYHQAGNEKKGQKELTDVGPVLSCNEIRVQYCPRNPPKNFVKSLSGRRLSRRK